MNVVPPQIESIRSAFPQIKELALLRTGGFKAVYKVVIGKEQEALKLIPISKFAATAGADNEAMRGEIIGRLRREVRTLSQCLRPEIVKLGSIELSEIKLDEEDWLAYSEELLAGSDLWNLIQAKGPKPDLRELTALFVAMLRAIQELSRLSEPIVHRDISPMNVIKTNDVDRPFVVLDLGIAFSPAETALTFNPALRLPPANFRYLPPEMMNPNFRESIDYRSDLYSAALTVFEYAAQHHPLVQSGDDMIQTISRAIRSAPISLTAVRPDLAPDFCRTIDQLLKKKPALRPANLMRLIQLMERLQ